MGKKARKRDKTALVVASDAEQFASYSVGDPAFAAWWMGTETGSETVSASTVLGLSAALRACMIISGTIASLPLRTYERHGADRVRVDSVFDDPYAGVDGMTSFEWVETVLLHDVLWRNAYLWHDARDRQGDITVYRPLYPEVITKVERVAGRKRFSYYEDGQTKTVGSDWITHIPGPSVDGVQGFSILAACRRIFSGAIAGDKAASTTLSGGIRLAGLLTPADGVDIEQPEGEEILKQLRPSVMGNENAGSIAFINRDLKLQPWTPTNVQSQWHETRTEILGEIGRIFGVPPHLLGDTEKQTSWGTGVAEQNLGLARYTLMPWSSRVEQRLTQRLPRGQFVEFDYKGLLQGTPKDEIELLIAQKDAGILDIDEVRKVLNLPPLTSAQKAAMAPPAPPRPIEVPIAAAREPDRSEDLTRYAELQTLRDDRLEERDRRGFERMLAGLASLERTVTVNTPDVRPVINVTTPDVRVDAQTHFAEGAFHNETVNPEVMVIEATPLPPLTKTVYDFDEAGEIVGEHPEPLDG